jgi:flagellar P-ring protein FlgI
MTRKHLFPSIALLALAPIWAAAQFAPSQGQAPPPPKQNSKPARNDGSTAAAALKAQQQLAQIAAEKATESKAERDGIGVRLDSICHFRGTWSQQLLGVGLVTGLDHSGDSQSYIPTQYAAANMLKAAGVEIDPTNTNTIAKNIALVTVTCELPPYSSPGQRLDVTVSAIGDATSLRNGTLIFTPLKYPGNDKVTFAVASGAVSVGGFSAKSSGNSASRGFVTVGKVPGGAIVQTAVATNTVIGGKMYLDLEQEDVITTERIEEKIRESSPELAPHAMGAGSVEVTLPPDTSVSSVQAKLMSLEIQADTPAKVVIDERSGTIIIGGSVRVSPCAIARGSISVQVTEDYGVSQPAPLSAGQTVATATTSLTAKEDTAQVALLKPNTTVADLAEIFQALKLKAEDIIAIMENLAAQGALKAKLVIQ